MTKKLVSLLLRVKLNPFRITLLFIFSVAACSRLAGAFDPGFLPSILTLWLIGIPLVLICSCSSWLLLEFPYVDTFVELLLQAKRQLRGLAEDLKH